MKSALQNTPRPEAVYESAAGEFVVSTDRSRLDIPFIHAFLSRESYWAQKIPVEVVRRSIAHSLCFGVYSADGRQVGFSRVVTDFATFGYICDVFIDPEFRGRKLSHALVAAILRHPELQGFRRWHLATRDAHGLYAAHGFRPVSAPENHMEIRDPEVYQRSSGVD